jgi:leucyl aminopeptidase
VLDHFTDAAKDAIPITPILADDMEAWLASRGEFERAWIAANAFKAERGSFLKVPAEDGAVAEVLVGVGIDANALWDVAGLRTALPEGVYRFNSADAMSAEFAEPAALGWALGGYRFDKYKSRDDSLATLVWPEGADKTRVTALANAMGLSRDLITTPANEMGPEELADAAKALADEFGAEYRCVVDEELLTHNFPAIYAVGAGSDRRPRLIEVTWGSDDAPKITLVGKGVCFDTGGYDLKASAYMRLMKKDMGGAAIVLGLAHAIMATGLPIRLRVLIPAVENSVSGHAMRPGDVLQSRAGKTIEVGNTDAEGRLVLADALTLASEEDPDLLIDVATLTGAARVALGLGMPALFTNDDAVATALQDTSHAVGDPLWRLPLWAPYNDLIKSKIADLSNLPSEPFGGAITAALFLQNFIGESKSWVHIDAMAYTNGNKPGRPEGGEAQSLRALYRYINDMYG